MIGQLWGLCRFGFLKAYRSKIFASMLLLFMPILVAVHLFDVYNTGFQVKFVKDVSLNFMSFFAILILAFLAMDHLFWPLEMKPPFYILGRIKSRLVYLAGTWLGIILSIASALLSSGVLILLFLRITRGIWFWEVFPGAFLLFLKYSLLAAFVLFCSCFSTRLIALSLSLVVFFMGHGLDSMRTWIESNANRSFQIVVDIFLLFVPDFAMFDSRLVMVQDSGFSVEGLFLLMGYTICLSSFFLFFGSQLLKGRDL